MGPCLSSDDKPRKPPPTKEELGGSGGQRSPTSPENVNVEIVDQGRPLPSTPLRKGISYQHCFFRRFQTKLYLLHNELYCSPLEYQ